MGSLAMCAMMCDGTLRKKGMISGYICVSFDDGQWQMERRGEICSSSSILESFFFSFSNK